nr:hypothetical protein [uncultured Clostridium sp.]
MTEIEMLLTKLERALSDFQGFDGWMIGKCNLNITNQLAIKEKNKEEFFKAGLLKRNNMLAVFQVYGNQGRLEGRIELTLVKPYLTNSIKKGSKDKTGKRYGTLVFSPEQVSRFLDSVSDTNPIHTGDDPIVPGFMIINQVVGHADEIMHKKTWDSFKTEVKFLSPMRIGQPAELWLEDIDPDGFRICGFFKESEIFNLKIN